MSGAAATFLLLLLSGRAALTVCRSLNAPRDGTDGLTATVTGVDRRWRPVLEKTRPFVLVDGQRRSLAEALQDGHPNRLQCGLEVGGQLFLLDLEKNHDLLPKPPNVFYYLPNGTGVSVTADPVTHCYYHGSVRGFPQSRVALSTCSGLRGVIAINSTLSFELQPQEDDHHHPHQQGEEEGGGGESGGDGSEGSGGGEGGEEGVHLLFSTSPLEGDVAGGCVVSHTALPPIHSFTHTHRKKRDILSETKYIELVLVADHQEFMNYQKNNNTIIYRMLDVANQVDWFYRPLNVRVALTGLEIWSDRDKIQVEKSPTDTLNNFLEWRTRELLPRLRHDNAQLVMGGSFDGTTVGMASQSSMCSRDRSGGVNVDHLVSVLGVASTVAHELGHNLGMSHDTAERRCSCQNEPRLGGCIMEPSTGFMPGQQFSSCSAADLSVSLLHGGGMCLFNVPQPDLLLGGPRCGNLYLERGEECDCGLLEECDDPCCNASTCQLLPGAQCSSDGICCHNCKLRAAGSVCREPIGECDLPEFCTGSSPHCPPNVFLQNGELCEDGASYCYGGVCASMNTQCQTLWGPNATSAPAVCFSSVNKQGNKHGNCGQLNNRSYVPCGNSDVHCGRIQCQGGRERPLLGTNAEILTTTVRFNVSDLICRGTFFHLGDDVSDPATVAQGTACGLGKACLNQKCQDVSVFGVDDCRRKCNGHGSRTRSESPCSLSSSSSCQCSSSSSLFASLVCVGVFSVLDQTARFAKLDNTTVLLTVRCGTWSLTISTSPGTCNSDDGASGRRRSGPTAEIPPEPTGRHPNDAAPQRGSSSTQTYRAKEAPPSGATIPSPPSPSPTSTRCLHLQHQTPTAQHRRTYRVFQKTTSCSSQPTHHPSESRVLVAALSSMVASPPDLRMTKTMMMKTFPSSSLDFSFKSFMNSQKLSVHVSALLNTTSAVDTQESILRPLTHSGCVKSVLVSENSVPWRLRGLIALLEDPGIKPRII
ncbi:disintegrin and metalloproteinase domain-containing protein 15 isoform X2 [Hippoglossus stenolepis]|uniref:disintegrin and metalloproteinase domain-containing protein 15 isoform X2 n=1 Tax=Hippoglossus stenolepis TaxID=195615 RepID=UPI00159CBF81|nr:disintegrin and metalloproteinase domain-containing protein 15 isoform X2 [Hippoglossus stenolepis]